MKKAQNKLLHMTTHNSNTFGVSPPWLRIRFRGNDIAMIGVRWNQLERNRR